MVEKTEINRIKSGEIFVLSTDYFSIVCKFCVNEFRTLDDVRVRLSLHFPELPMNFKEEESISCTSDCKPIPLDDNVSENLIDSSDESQPNTFVEDSSRPLNELEIIKRESIEPKQAFKLQPTSENEKQNKYNQKVHEKALKTIVEKSGPLAFSSNDEQQKMTSNEKKAVHKCLVCNKIFARKSPLNDHTREHLPDSDPRRFFPCKLCGNKFKSRHQLNSHLQKHRKGRNSFICDICQTTFKTKQSLRYHLIMHSGVKPYKCQHCQIPFAAPSGRCHHEKRCSKRTDLDPEMTAARRKRKLFKYECRFCNKRHRTKEAHNDHENSHTGRRPHQCHICHKTYTTRSNMRLHVKSHTNNRKYSCHACEKSYVLCSSLKLHVREHHLSDTDPRRYFQCRICNVKFKTEKTLRYHNETHKNDVRMFSCDYCQRPYKRKDHLIRHMRINHSFVNECKHCSKAFSKSGSWKLHEVECLMEIKIKSQISQESAVPAVSYNY